MNQILPGAVQGIKLFLQRQGVMRRRASRPAALWAAADMVCAVAAMAIAFWLRFGVFRGVNPVGGFGYHMLWAALFSPVYPVLYGLLGAYSPDPRKSFTRDYGRIVLGNTLGVMLYIDLIFVFRVVDFSRWMILFFYLTLNLFTGTRGLAAHRRLRAALRRGEGLRTVVILGDGDAARDCFERLSRSERSGCTVLGSIGERDIPGLRRLGSYDRLRAVLDETAPEEAIIAIDESQAEALGGILRECEDTGVKLALLPVCYAWLSARPFIEETGGLPLINIRRVALDDPAADLLKRVMDILGSALLLVLTSPVMLLAAVGTRLSSPGPILFRQERIGRDRKPFQMLKFRSMRLNAAADTAWTREGDPRRTRFGAFMRRYSIDELPQLFNVLRGDMSLVGPRPEIPKYVDHFKYSIPLYMVRHRVRPGITGWAQVNGLRGDTSIQARVDYDLYYIENWSPFFDLKILLMTPFKGVVNRQESLMGQEKKKKGESP